MPTVERAATVAALAVTKQLAVRAVESKYQADFLRDLLTGQVVPEVGVSHAASLGWDVDRPVVVVVAELDPGEGEEQASTLVTRPAGERFAAAWQTVVRPRDPQAAVAGFHREVVAVLGVPGSGDVERLVRELVREVSGDGGGGRRSFGTGVSRVAATPDLIPGAYEQARTAVRVGRRVQGPGALAHFDALGVFRLLSLVHDGSELRAFAEETLGPLARSGGSAAEQQESADLRQHARGAARCEPQRRAGGTAAPLPLQHAALPDREARAAARPLRGGPATAALAPRGSADPPDARRLTVPR